MYSNLSLLVHRRVRSPPPSPLRQAAQRSSPPDQHTPASDQLSAVDSGRPAISRVSAPVAESAPSSGTTDRQVRRGEGGGLTRLGATGAGRRIWYSQRSATFVSVCSGPLWCSSDGRRKRCREAARAKLLAPDRQGRCSCTMWVQVMRFWHERKKCSSCGKLGLERREAFMTCGR